MPIFCAYPDPEGRTESGRATGYILPKDWQKTTPNPAYVDAWRPGMALCAVMGYRLDLVDDDPRNGGDLAALNGTMPVIYGVQATPSGGWHFFVKSMGVGSRDGVLPGIDVKAGTGDGSTDHGFAFIAPTVRKSKTTGEPGAYQWIKPPDTTALEGDDRSGEQLAELVRRARAPKHAREPSGALFQQPATRQLGDRVPPGGRHAALVSYAGWLRSLGLPLPEAEVLILARFHDLEQPPGNAPYTEDDARAKLRDVYSRYEAGDPSGDDGSAERREISARKRQLRIDAEARAELAADTMPAIPAVTSGADFLAQPDEATAWRVEGLWPAGGNVVLAAQFKAGKTTLTGNLVRSWCDGAPFLGQYAISQPDGPLLLIDTEMSSDTARRWLRGQGITQASRFRYISLRGQAAALNMLTAAGRARWAELATGCAGVILDPAGPVLGALGLDENSNTDVIRFLAGWDEMLAMAGVPESLIAHHMGHGAERSRGASRLRDWPDAEWRLVRQDDDPSSPRYLSAYGRDVDVPETRLAYDPATRQIQVAGGNRRQAQEAAVREALTQLLADTPGLNGSQIEAALTGRLGRDPVRAGLAEAVAAKDVTVTAGPRGAKIYTLSSRVRGTSRTSRPRGAESVRGPIEAANSRAENGEASSRADPRQLIACPECFRPVLEGQQCNHGQPELETAQ